MFRCDLVDRNAHSHGVFLWLSSAQENRGRARVFGACIGARRGLVCEIAYDRKTFSILFERAECFGKLEVFAFS
jgi:hypothetical protein